MNCPSPVVRLALIRALVSAAEPSILEAIEAGDRERATEFIDLFEADFAAFERRWRIEGYSPCVDRAPLERLRARLEE